MTSEERRELRYQRRKARREVAKDSLRAVSDDFNTVFSYGNLYDAYRKCRRGVSWKASVQKYIAQAPINVFSAWQRLQNGTYRSPGFFEFDIFERGKPRHIRSTVISERVVQRCLCDNALVPMLSRSFIYDSGASLEGKGYDFAIRRLTQHLQEHYRRYGTEGYVLLFDFSKFFDRISHAVVKADLHRKFGDRKIVALTEHLIDAFGDVGMGLGSQISQVLALASANRLDHYIKEVCRIRVYGRYMDDGYLLHPSREYLQHCLDGIKGICDELGITLNLRKTQITKLSRGFTWLKVRFYLSDDGKVVKKICKRSITRMRRKMKKLHVRYRNGQITMVEIQNMWQSWYHGYAERFAAYHTRNNMEVLFARLFIGGCNNAIHQSDQRQLCDSGGHCGAVLCSPPDQE